MLEKTKICFFYFEFFTVLWLWSNRIFCRLIISKHVWFRKRENDVCECKTIHVENENAWNCEKNEKFFEKKEMRKKSKKIMKKVI